MFMLWHWRALKSKWNLTLKKIKEVEEQLDTKVKAANQFKDITLSQIFLGLSIRCGIYHLVSAQILTIKTFGEDIFIFYAMLPFDSIRLALADLNLIERSRLKSFQMVKRATNSEANMKTQIEEVKFFEQAFEALPQLILIP